MGMFDFVYFRYECPFCRSKISDFQTKDGSSTLSILEPKDVKNFYTSCDKCDAWVEFNYIRPCVYKMAAIDTEGYIITKGVNIKDTDGIEDTEELDNISINKSYTQILEDALTDVVDGNDEHDLVSMTGLSEERCKEIVDLFNMIIEKKKILRSE